MTGQILEGRKWGGRKCPPSQEFLKLECGVGASAHGGQMRAILWGPSPRPPVLGRPIAPGTPIRSSP